MDCNLCGQELCWGSDADYADCGLEGEGIVSFFTCLNDECPVEAVEVYARYEDQEVQDQETDPQE